MTGRVQIDPRRLTPAFSLLVAGSATAWHTYRRRPETTSRRATLKQVRSVAHAYLDAMKRTIGGSEVSFRLRRDEQGPVVLEQREAVQGAIYSRSFTCS